MQKGETCCCNALSIPFVKYTVIAYSLRLWLRCLKEKEQKRKSHFYCFLLENDLNLNLFLLVVKNRFQLLNYIRSRRLRFSCVLPSLCPLVKRSVFVSLTEGRGGCLIVMLMRFRFDWRNPALPRGSDSQLRAVIRGSWTCSVRWTKYISLAEVNGR